MMYYIINVLNRTIMGFLDQSSIHGHLQCKSLKNNGLPVLQGTNGFEVESVSSHAIQVKHTSCSSVTLISPYRVFNDVHNTSVSTIINQYYAQNLTLLK